MRTNFWDRQTDGQTEKFNTISLRFTGDNIKILVLFLALFWRRFGPITLKLPGAKLQLICFHMVYVSIL